MRYIDLFCGIGSFHYSFRKRGWECVMSCDNSKSVCDTYHANYGMLPSGDVVDLDPNDVKGPIDIVCAGFPCQPFSCAGKKMGLGDPRGGMFFHVMRFVSHHKPRVVILENVPGLLRNDNGKTFDMIMNCLSDVGYRTSYRVLNCSDYGLPQMRKRLFIVSSRDSGIDPERVLDVERFRCKVTLSEFFGKRFDKKFAYTVRCSGRHSRIHTRHNWTNYVVDGAEYSLSINDALLLQGFPSDFRLVGSLTAQWKMLGNTIPTVFTDMIASNLCLDHEPGG